MGDEVVIERIEFLYGHLWQIDLYNKTKNEHYRAFCENQRFEMMQIQAKLKELENRNKEQARIETMAEEIEKRVEYAKNVVGSMNKGIGYWIAEDLVNKNYRKIIPNVDFVVRAGELSTIQMNTRKETAKECKKLFLENIKFTRDERVQEYVIRVSYDEVIRKENIMKDRYGVEVKE